jgi:hypothetical protein
VAFFFFRNGFRVVEWELMGANKRQGEFAIKTPSGTDVFVEVKGRSWEGELSKEERDSGTPKSFFDRSGLVSLLDLQRKFQFST